MSDLLPCPFCGNSATIYHDTSSDHERQWTWGVNCDDWGDCGASITGAASRDAVIAVWNRRKMAPVAHSHRNGETARPTQSGRFWFDGTCATPTGDIGLRLILDVTVPDGMLLAWEERTAEYLRLDRFDGWWWGPVVAPWE